MEKKGYIFNYESAPQTGTVIVWRDNEYRLIGKSQSALRWRTDCKKCSKAVRFNTALAESYLQRYCKKHAKAALKRFMATLRGKKRAKAKREGKYIKSEPLAHITKNLLPKNRRMRKGIAMRVLKQTVENYARERTKYWRKEIRLNRISAGDAKIKLDKEVKGFSLKDKEPQKNPLFVKTQNDHPAPPKTITPIKTKLLPRSGKEWEKWLKYEDKLNDDFLHSRITNAEASRRIREQRARFVASDIKDII